MLVDHDHSSGAYVYSSSCMKIESMILSIVCIVYKCSLYMQTCAVYKYRHLYTSCCVICWLCYAKSKLSDIRSLGLVLACTLCSSQLGHSTTSPGLGVRIAVGA